MPDVDYFRSGLTSLFLYVMDNNKDFTVLQHIEGALIFAKAMEDCFSKEPIINILNEALLKAEQIEAERDRLREENQQLEAVLMKFIKLTGGV